jgi:cation diffusion facilitator CzcD-associated flavoprotein CzcO
MSAASALSTATTSMAQSGVEHRDVIIIGAGVSGIGAACQLSRKLPGKTFAILEGRKASGGTWDLFRFPGIRSDSDLYTYGYEFKPWQGKPIATAQAIRDYLSETCEEFGIEEHIRYQHSVASASWSTIDALWTVEATDAEGVERRFTASFLWMCAGYFNYEAGHFPEFAGQDDFKGDLIHPQKWPEGYDYTGREVVVVGSGATAVTLIPAMVEQAKHVTMLQRSPSYVMSRENSDDEYIAQTRALELPDDWLHEIIRRYNLENERQMTWRTRNEPEEAAAELIGLVRDALPEGYDVEKHFTPTYQPWDERLCLVPDGDLFEAISSGKASVVTDEIETLTADGIRLKSGENLKADLIVAATGIELQALGGIAFFVDGESVDLPECWSWRGMMLSGMPNLAWTFGYIRTSWTMRADMVANFVCRLLGEMDQRGVRQCTPGLRQEDNQMRPVGYIDEEDFAPGYMRRGMHRLPRQGDHLPWTNPQDFYVERESIPGADLDDGTLVFDNPTDDLVIAAGG